MDKPVQPEAAKAYSYVRFSTPAQSKGDSLLRQTEKAQAYADRHGLVLDTEFNLRDLGVSGYTGANVRAGALGEFLRAVQSGIIPKGSILLIENLDRLTRADVNTAVMLFVGMIDAGIKIVNLTRGVEWSKEGFKENAYAFIEITVELIRGNQESVRKSQLIGDAKARLRERLLSGEVLKRPYTRQTPAWLRWDEAGAGYELIPDRAMQINGIFESADVGQGIDSIAQSLNAAGVPTWGGRGRKATHWHASYIRKILTNQSAIGLFTPKTSSKSADGARVDVADSRSIKLFPAAVAEDLYWRVARKFAATAARGRNAGAPAQSIVAGIAKCSVCGGSMVRTNKGEGLAYLVCSRANAKAGNCKWLAVRYDLVEAELVGSIEWIVKQAPRGKSTATIDRDIRQLDFDCERLADEGSELTRELASSRSALVRTRLREIDAELLVKQGDLRAKKAQRETVTTASVKERLKEVQRALEAKPLNVVIANQALRGALSGITLDYVGGRMELQWHHEEKPQELEFITRHTPPVTSAFNVVDGGYAWGGSEGNN